MFTVLVYTRGSEKLSSFIIAILMIFFTYHLHPCNFNVTEGDVGFRYDIFTRAAYVVLKEGGSPATPKKCKLHLPMYFNQRPIPFGFGFRCIHLAGPRVTFNPCASFRQSRTCCIIFTHQGADASTVCIGIDVRVQV